MNPTEYLRSRPRLNLLLLAAWPTLIFIGSSIPQDRLPPEMGPYSPLLHAVEFFVLAYLAYAYAKTPNPLLAAAAASCLFGAADEAHQLFVPGRNASFLDFISDSAGSVAGAYAAGLWGEK